MKCAWMRRTERPTCYFLGFLLHKFYAEIISNVLAKIVALGSCAGPDNDFFLT